MAVLNKYRLDNINADVKNKFAAFIADLEKAGFTVILTSGYRSLTEQSVLYSKDQRNAKPGYSAHNYGYAIDLNLFKAGKDYKKATPVKEWREAGVPAIASRHGLRWGGDLKGYEDPVHFDATKVGDTERWAKSLQAQYGTRAYDQQTNKMSWMTA